MNVDLEAPRSYFERGIGGALFACAFVSVITTAGIVLVLLKANATNAIVSDVHDAARWLAGPFDGMFSFRDPKVALSVNWGIAAVVYLIVGGLIARLFRSHR